MDDLKNLNVGYFGIFSKRECLHTTSGQNIIDLKNFNMLDIL